MPSLHRWKVISVLSVLLVSAGACSDAPTALLAAPQAEVVLPQITLPNGVTLTLVGTDLMTANGQRIPVGAAAAKKFRIVAEAAPEVKAMANRLRPVMAKMAADPKVRSAAAAYRANPGSATAVLKGALPTLTEAPVKKKPTLIAECDPVYTFCGFDTGDPENPGGGGSGGGGASGPCITYFGAMVLYGVGATVAFAALPFGALAAFASGGILAPAELALVMIWVYAEAQYLTAIGDYTSCTRSNP